MHCVKCNQPIPEERLKAIETKFCIKCAPSITKPVGFMIYEHKTAPVLVMINPENKEDLRLAKRANKRSR